MNLTLRHLITRLGEQTARPWAFLIVAAYALAWWYFERETFDWHAYATVAVWCMTLFIQRSQQRDSLALQAKLDELIRVSSTARNELARLDEDDLEDIQEHREEQKRQQN